jgi:hypothetical protein
MDPVLPLDDSEDEACLYLKTVQHERLRLSCNPAKVLEIQTDDWFIPKSQLPNKETFQVSSQVKEEVVKRFTRLRKELQEKRKPVEKKRNREMIQRILNEQRPFWHVVEELDHLGVVKVLNVIAEMIEDFLRLEEWIYCLLCLVEMPFDLDLYSVLNVILKKAMEFQENPSTKVIIIIITEYFGQRLP